MKGMGGKWEGPEEPPRACPSCPARGGADSGGGLGRPPPQYLDVRAKNIPGQR